MSGNKINKVSKDISVSSTSKNTSTKNVSSKNTKEKSHNDLVKVVSRVNKIGTNSKLKNIINIFENNDLDDMEKKNMLATLHVNLENISQNPNPEPNINIDGLNAERILLNSDNVSSSDASQNIVRDVPSFKNRLNNWEQRTDKTFSKKDMIDYTSVKTGLTHNKSKNINKDNIIVTPKKNKTIFKYSSFY